MLLPICGLEKHDPGPRFADFVILPYCWAFRRSSGPFVQFSLRLTSTTTEKDSCLQIIVILLKTNKTKLRRDDYAAKCLLSQSCLLCPLGPIRHPEQSHRQSTNKTSAAAIRRKQAHDSLLESSYLASYFASNVLGDNWSYFTKEEILEKWLKCSFFVHTVLLDSTDDLAANLRKSTTVFVTAHSEEHIKLSSGLYSQISLPAFLGS